MFRGIVDYRPVKPGLSQAAKGKAYRVRLSDWDAGSEEYLKLLAQLGEDPNADKLQALVLGGETPLALSHSLTLFVVTLWWRTGLEPIPCLTGHSPSP